MAHQLSDGDVRLAVLGKFRPVFRYRRVKIELAAIGDQQSGQCGHRLGRRIDIDDRVGFPGPGFFLVGPAAPDIDDRFAVNRGAKGGSDIGTTFDACSHNVAHMRKPVLAGPVYQIVCHRLFLSG